MTKTKVPKTKSKVTPKKITNKLIKKVVEVDTENHEDELNNSIKDGKITFPVDQLNPISTTITSYKTNPESQDDLQAARNIADYLVKNNKMTKEVNFDGNNRITTYSIQIFNEN